MPKARIKTPDARRYEALGLSYVPCLLGRDKVPTELEYIEHLTVLFASYEREYGSHLLGAYRCHERNLL
jgi:hypothetical protein